MSVTALVLAAGQGTRMKSDRPKVIHEVLGTPMIHLVCQASIDAGADRVIVVTGHQAERVTECINGMDGLETVTQTHRIGTANAVSVVQDMIADQEGVLVVVAGDVPLIRPETINKLIADCVDNNAAMSVLTAVFENPEGYGRIIRDEAGYVTEIVEHKDATPNQLKINETNTGTYVFALDGLFERLDRIDNKNVKGEYYLTDIVKICLEDGLKVRALAVDDNDETMGVNTQAQLAHVSGVLHDRICRHWMDVGVTIISPATTWVGPNVVLGTDVEIWPNTYLRGNTTVDSGAIVGPDTRIVDSVVGPCATVDSSIVLQSSIGEGATVGPRSYLRPGCVLDPWSKVGTSCELKNVHLGEGSKVPHLSYVGDAEIGTGVNLGAGTITCNYDGFQKFRTVIEDGVFVGSDTMLVAPVTIGAGATIGAGSVITKDVAAGSLAIERSEQRVIDGWTKDRRENKAEG